jgi:hypothetical protein
MAKKSPWEKMQAGKKIDSPEEDAAEKAGGLPNDDAEETKPSPADLAHHMKHNPKLTDHIASKLAEMMLAHAGRKGRGTK